MIDQFSVNGSIFNFELSKFTETDAVESSGLVTPPSHSPVSVSRAAKLESVGVGDKGVGDVNVGVAVWDEQADSTQSRRKVDRMRMHPNIIERIVEIPIQMDGSKKDPS